MDKSGSEYHLSLEYLLKSYGVFVLSLREYLTTRAPSPKLHSLLHIWNHPRGIYNLIRTLALQYAAHSTDDARLRLPEGSLPIIPVPTTTPSAIEVANPRFVDSAVKVEENAAERAESAGYGQAESGCEESGASVSGRSYKRGPYKSYSMAEKEAAVRLLVEEELPITEISRKLRIPCKNIKRWSTQGVFRKSGGGRKRSSPKMEGDIKRWILQQFAEGEVIELDRVREYALAISGDETFKASRGWVCKFIDRARLRDLYTFR